MLNRMDVDVAKLGDNTGELSGLRFTAYSIVKVSVHVILCALNYETRALSSSDRTLLGIWERLPDDP